MISHHPHDADSANRQTNDNTSAVEWPALIPIDEHMLPEFPVDALPLTLENWVAEEAEATQTPRDMAALLSIAVCGAMIAKRVRVSPWQGWSEPCNLYVAAILDPANRKSSVFADATKPLREVEAKQREDATESVAEELSDYRQAEARLKKLERTAAENADASRRNEAKLEARDLAKRLSKWPKPEEPTLIVDDVTSEKLAIMLQANGERIASMSAEGGVFDLMAGRYSGGATDINVYLMAHSGDSVSVNRVGRSPVHLESPAITMALAIQPEVIRGVAGNQAFRGRGLLGRFFYAVPQSLIGRRRVATRPVSDKVATAYSKLIRSLSKIEAKEDGSSHQIKLSEDAVLVFTKFCQWIENELGSGSLESMRDWGGKLAGATLRIAAIIHCAGHAGVSGLKHDISEETIKAAQRIALWAIPHAAAALDLLEVSDDEARDDARYLLRWLKGDRTTERTFDRNDARRHGHRRFDRAPERLDAALHLLESTGHIANLNVPRTGGRVTYAVSPFVTGVSMKTESLSSGANGANRSPLHQRSERPSLSAPLAPVPGDSGNEIIEVTL